MCTSMNFPLEKFNEIYRLVPLLLATTDEDIGDADDLSCSRAFSCNGLLGDENEI